GAAAIGFAFTVVSVELIENTHTRDDFTKWREPRRVEPRVVGIIDKNLSRAGIGAGCGKGDPSASIRHDYRIVADCSVGPFCCDRRIAADAELCHEWLRCANHAEKPNVIIETVLH